MKQIERLLFLQGQRCFFCDGRVPAGEASVEHLVASANGGTNDDSNCVVCCTTLNAAFGSRSLKDKLQAVLKHRGPFICPRTVNMHECAKPVHHLDAQLRVVVADLQRRGPAKPRSEKTLRNTIAAALRQKLTEKQLSSLLARLQAKAFVSITDGKVTYNLPAKGFTR